MHKQSNKLLHHARLSLNGISCKPPGGLTPLTLTHACHGPDLGTWFGNGQVENSATQETSPVTVQVVNFAQPYMTS